MMMECEDNNACNDEMMVVTKTLPAELLRRVLTHHLLMMSASRHDIYSRCFTRHDEMEHVRYGIMYASGNICLAPADVAAVV